MNDKSTFNRYSKIEIAAGAFALGILVMLTIASRFVESGDMLCITFR